MKKFLLLTTTLFIACSLSACQTTKNLSNPCDVIVRLTPSERTALDIVVNDKRFAQQVAQGRERYKHYKCGKL